MNNNKNDVAGKPQSGACDSKNKQGQLERHPRKGRTRPPNSEDELDCGKENTTSQEKVKN